MKSKKENAKDAAEDRKKEAKKLLQAIKDAERKKK